MYVRTRDRVKSGHQVVNMIDMNIPLKNMILSSRKETIKNMQIK